MGSSWGEWGPLVGGYSVQGCRNGTGLSGGGGPPNPNGLAPWRVNWHDDGPSYACAYFYHGLWVWRGGAEGSDWVGEVEACGWPGTNPIGVKLPGGRAMGLTVDGARRRRKRRETVRGPIPGAWSRARLCWSPTARPAAAGSCQTVRRPQLVVVVLRIINNYNNV